MKTLNLSIILFILLTSCADINSPLISKDFEGKLLLETENDKVLYIADRDGQTQVPIFDSLDIINEGCEWIRDGEVISYFQTVYCLSCSYGTLRVIQPDGKLVRDFKYDFGWIYASSFSPAGNRMAIIKSSSQVQVYGLDTAFNPILLDSVMSEVLTSIEWSPDGERFLFKIPGDIADHGVAIYDLSTRSKIQIFEYSEHGLVTPFQSPGWSADGNSVSFILNNILYINDANGSGTFPVSIEDQKVLIAVWSNVAHELAYIRWAPETDRAEMVIYDPYTEDRTVVWEERALGLDLRFSKWQLKWSKDGHSIAFNTSLGEQIGIFSINRDGTDFRQLYDGNVLSFDWHED